MAVSGTRVLGEPVADLQLHRHAELWRFAGSGFFSRVVGRSQWIGIGIDG